MCSTPYGIRGLAPQTSPWKSFRHLCCAQRLTASEVWHEGDRRFDAACLRAQRLTASEVWHAALQAWVARRPGCSTPYGIRGLARDQKFAVVRRQLLTRAQRLTASEVWHQRLPSALVLNRLCSTPYGIRGLARGCWHRLKRAHVVLNALRHQRFGTLPRAYRPSCPWLCSTPYGIRGLAPALPAGLLPLCGHAGAQRLTASEVWHSSISRT